MGAKQLTDYHEEPIKNRDDILATKQKLDENVALLYNWKEEYDIKNQANKQTDKKK